jgi:hypothetical protein
VGSGVEVAVAVGVAVRVGKGVGVAEGSGVSVAVGGRVGVGWGAGAAQPATASHIMIAQVAKPGKRGLIGCASAALLLEGSPPMPCGR